MKIASQKAQEKGKIHLKLENLSPGNEKVRKETKNNYLKNLLNENRVFYEDMFKKNKDGSYSSKIFNMKRLNSHSKEQLEAFFQNIQTLTENFIDENNIELVKKIPENLKIPEHLKNELNYYHEQKQKEKMDIPEQLKKELNIYLKDKKKGVDEFIKTQNKQFIELFFESKQGKELIDQIAKLHQTLLLGSALQKGFTYGVIMIISAYILKGLYLLFGSEFILSNGDIFKLYIGSSVLGAIGDIILKYTATYKLDDKQLN